MKHRFELRALLDCWRVARSAQEVQFSDGRRVRLETNLGFKLGTRVFLEEIVGPFYSNVVQGLVYAAAMLVLIGVGLYLGGGSVWIPVAAFAIEAFFLLLMAIVTAYGSREDTNAISGAAASDAVMASISNTVRDMTNAVSDLFRLISQSDIRQDVLLTKLTEHISKTQADTTRQYTAAINETNALLREQANALHAAITLVELAVAGRAGTTPAAAPGFPSPESA